MIHQDPPLPFYQLSCYLVLLVDMDPLLHQVLYGLRVSLPCCPVHGAIPLLVHLAKVGPMASKNTEHLQSSKTCSNVHTRLPMFVGLVDVDIGDSQQLLETSFVVLLYGAEYGRQDKIVILNKEILARNPKLRSQRVT